jgi:hypothetical protein
MNAEDEITQLVSKAKLLSEVDRLQRVAREAALVVQASRRDSITGCCAPELEALARAVDALEAKP